MDITGITIRKITSEGKMKAIISVTFDQVFVVHDIKVIEGNSGCFIAMPSRKARDGTFKDIVHPITCDFRETLSAAVLEKYREALASRQLEDDDRSFGELGIDGDSVPPYVASDERDSVVQLSDDFEATASGDETIPQLA